MKPLASVNGCDGTRGDVERRRERRLRASSVAIDW
jgi:hypothetical protein